MEEYNQDNQEYYNPVPVNQNIQSQTKEVPVGAKVISVWYYLQAAAAVVLLIIQIVKMIKNSAMMTGNLPFLMLFLSILFSGGIITLFVLIGKGLWNGKAWARATAIVFAIITLVLYIIILAMGSLVFAVVGFNSQQLLLSILKIILIIGINSFVAGYLIFSKEVEECFKEKIPLGVQILSVWSYIWAVICAILGIVSIVGVGAAGVLFSSLASEGAGIFTVIGVLVLGIGVLNFFIGRGLWRAQNWARIISIVFGILGILLGIYSIFKGLTYVEPETYYSLGVESIVQTYIIVAGVIVILFYGLIAGYLLFSEKVKEAFKNTKTNIN